MPYGDRCPATTRNGDPCGFTPRNDTGFCINHDPAYRQQQRQNVRRAASASVESRRRAAEVDLGHIDLSTRAGVQAALESVIRLELEGRLSNARARNLLRGLSIAARNFDSPGLDDRSAGRPVQHPPDRMLALRIALATQLATLPPNEDEQP